MRGICLWQISFQVTWLKMREMGSVNKCGFFGGVGSDKPS